MKAVNNPDVVASPQTPAGVCSSDLVGRRYMHSDSRIIATVISQSLNTGYVILQKANGVRLLRTIESLKANWIEMDEPPNERS